VAEIHYQERCTCRDIARFLNLPVALQGSVERFWG